MRDELRGIGEPIGLDRAHHAMDIHASWSYSGLGSCPHCLTRCKRRAQAQIYFAHTLDVARRMLFARATLARELTNVHFPETRGPPPPTRLDEVGERRYATAWSSMRMG